MIAIGVTSQIEEVLTRKKGELTDPYMTVGINKIK